MNGIHDMGGMQGFGKVEPEPNEPPFHTPWEGRALAMNRAMSYAQLWNIDRSRATIEDLPPAARCVPARRCRARSPLPRSRMR
jgi:nitrile hydratase